MNTDTPTRLSATVTLFTAVTDSAEVSGPLLRPLIRTGSPESFGLGLFTLTRKHTPGASAETSSDRELPSTFVGPEETVREAARRLVRDELGVEHRGYLHETRVFDAPHREEGERVVTFGYFAFVPFEHLVTVLGGREGVGLELVNSSQYIDHWFFEHGFENFDGVSRFGHRLRPTPSQYHKKVLTTQIHGARLLAHDHDDITFYAWRALRHAFVGALDPFRAIGTRVLGPEFSLSELRELYDVCRGERIQPDLFRRNLVRPDSYIEPVGRTTSSDSSSSQRSRGKPAHLFRLKNWANPESAMNTDAQG